MNSKTRKAKPAVGQQAKLCAFSYQASQSHQVSVASVIGDRTSTVESLGLQAELKVNTSGDRWEREAQSTAKRVMSDSSEAKPTISPKPKSLQKQSQPGSNTGSTIGRKPQRQVQEALSRPGTELEKETRETMESEFGTDFSKVRIHTDSAAARSADAINANAYTKGGHIVFGANQYQPSSRQGKTLIAHELTHTLQQSAASPNQIYRQEATAPVCGTTYRAATNFQSLIDLVRAAEAQLIACGHTEIGDRIHIIRGVFYGTTWSNDYAVEASPVRNLGFQTYTASTEPDDPRNCFSCNMFAALSGSQDIVDGSRRVDFGHLIIGLDARRSTIARNVPIPTQGGTGLAISTWLGDLGGGAAMTAFHRVGNPSRRAARNFTGSDFGGAINLEGDAAGFLVGKAGTSLGVPELDPTGNSIADWLETYLEPAGSSVGGEWNSRCTNFLQALGGRFDPSGAIINRTALIDDLTGQIEGFGCWYLVNRLRQSSRLSIATLRTASRHLHGSSAETAAIFVDALLHCHSHSGAEIRARTDPGPTAIGSASGGMCALTISTLEAAERGERWAREAEEAANEAGRRGSELLDDVEEGATDAWNDIEGAARDYWPFK